jgi:hypothetical protein
MPTIDIPKKVRDFAGMAEALAELVEIADKHNALVQFEAEHATRIAALTEQIAAKQQAVRFAEAQEDEARRQALAIMEQAKIDGQTIIDKAAAEADLIRKAADEAVEAAKAKERKAEADERKAKDNLASLAEQTNLLVAQVAEARAIIAKAEAIKQAMG